MAPPKKKIDVKVLEGLARIHCTMIEMASICECSVDTLERRYADVIKKAKDSGKASLRRIQWKLALEGNPTMQIWLGKQLLGQRDSVQAFTGDMTVYDGKDKSAKAELESILSRRLSRIRPQKMVSGNNGN